MPALPNSPMAGTSYAIYDDLSGVAETTDGFGIFPTELAAIETLILRLESDRTDIITKIANAKRRRRQIQRNSP